MVDSEVVKGMKRYSLFSIVFLMLAAAWVSGCGGGPTAVIPAVEPTLDQTPTAGQLGQVHETVGDEAATSAPTPEAGAQQATVTPASVPEPTQVKPLPEAVPPDGAAHQVRLAREDLAARLGLAVASEAIRLISVEPVEWSDASLGCTQPGMMYAEVITPGYMVVLEARGEEYRYHTDLERLVVLCEARGASGVGPPQPPDGAVQDGWPNETRDYDVTILPPAERK